VKTSVTGAEAHAGSSSLPSRWMRPVARTAFDSGSEAGAAAGMLDCARAADAVIARSECNRRRTSVRRVRRMCDGRRERAVGRVTDNVGVSMRNLSSILAIAALVAECACSNRDTTGPATPKSRGSMSAVIDGAAWSTVSISIDSLAPSSIVVWGSKATEKLAIAIPVDQGPGTQTVGSTTPLFAGLLSGSQSWLASRTQGGSGSVTLTTVVSGHLAGTFEFTLAAHDGSAPADRRVSSGQFDVRY